MTDEQEIDALTGWITQSLTWVAKGLFFGIGFYTIQQIAGVMS